MATIKPFPALLPQPELAPKICELPYDVVSSAEARAIASGNPLSFFHVSKPEIDLPQHTDPCDPAVYAKGRQNLLGLIENGALRKTKKANLYLYRQTMGSHQQLGLVALASCAEYENGLIRKHELTRPDKENDRVIHMQTLAAQTGPAFLTYLAQPELDQLCARLASGLPYADFQAPDGIRHTSWIIDQPDDIQQICAQVSSLPCLYIADGHHRSAAAARVARLRNNQGQSDFFLAVLFPHNQMQILPYHRVLRSLPGMTPTDLLRKLQPVFQITPARSPHPTRRHEIGLYLDSQWHCLAFRPEFTASQNPLETLDAALLQMHVLAPLFGIDDPRTNQDIAFVGGSRGTDELEKLVQSGAFACALALYPTGIEEMMAIADQGAVMPPKSTWFEPKLRDGMFCHLLEDPAVSP